MAEPARVFTIPAGVPFVDALAAGLLERAAGDPVRLADTLVLLPNRRAGRALRDGFLRAGQGRALLLPRLVPIGDVDEDELDAGEANLGVDFADIPPAIAPLRRQFLLARLLLRAHPGLDVGGVERAMRLAAELARLLDDAQTAGVTLDRLRDLAPEAYAEHWQKSLGFLAILTEHWPALLAAEARIDPADRRNRLLARLAAQWRAAPPAHPVVAAGSTGSVPATADLIAAVAALPTGTVVLPGLDRDLDEASWRALGDSHPQAALKRLLARLDVSRERVPEWRHGEGDRARPRARLLTDALRPAATLAAWLALPKPGPAALYGLARVECPTPQVEAGVVALAMRETLETPGATAALVTRDRTLARRVAEELGRWGIAVDDSAGQPLATTAPGAFLRLAAAVAEAAAAPVPLLALLKHPLAAGGCDPASFRAAVRAIELAVLRGPRPAPGFAGLAAALAERGTPGLRALVRRLDRAARRFMDLIGRPRVKLAQVLDAHVAFTEWLATTDAVPGDRRLWAFEAGEALARFVTEAREAGEALASMRGADYPGLLDALLAGRVVRPRFGRHPRLSIWGPLEARLQSADLMILGGLDEGSWPPLPTPDPWLSRPMRAALGLPAREARIGQAAHDFVQGAAAPRVLLTRSAKVDGSPTVASRWLVRLETMLAAHDRVGHLDAEAGERLAWQASLDRPARTTPMAKPRPTPPIDARPRRLSVTGVETWLGDPYAIYARTILRLAKLDPIDADPGAAERGQFIHDALDRFVKAYPRELPEDAYDRLMEHGRAAFGAALDRPDVHAFWWPRFGRIARWFIEQERERRAAVVHVLGEATGEVTLTAPAGPFVLTAKADRIEMRADGGLALIDYKTGARPRAKDADEGKAPQLPLEAVIAARGGFEGVPAAPITELAFWHLTGDEPAGQVVVPKGLVDTYGDAETGLGRLIERFDDPAMPYLACPRPDLAPRYNDYEPIERRDEWEGAPAAIPPFRPMPESHPGAPAPAPLPEQQAMSDPATSAWVAASAGTGKTKVLTDRVLRLLLGGSPPGRLLCLTFTKAAAAEMAIRIERRLGDWAVMAETELARNLSDLTGAAPAGADIERARRLFAEVLEAPGGLPIMTIHAFCQSLLARFPAEAGVAPGFEVADTRTARELQAEALDAVIGRSREDAILGRHMGVIAARARDVTVRALIEELVDARGRFAALLRRHGGLDGALRALRRALGVAPAATVEGLIAETVDPAFIDEPGLRRAADALGGGSDANRRLGAAIAAFLALPPARRIEGFNGYRRIFLTQKDEPRSRLMPPKLAGHHPEAAAALDAEAVRLAAFVERRNAIVTAEASVALYHVGQVVLDAYQTRKAARGLLDYQDLILIAADLVTRPGSAPWVLYKLDGGIDHILVDEAQDTNPDQWRIVAALVDEFFAGEGTSEIARTLFVVGDEKQSIFSFQGADLEGLSRVHEDLRARARAAGAPWLDRAMTLSFRSAPTILAAVDAVFERPEARTGVAPGGADIRHRANRAAAPGLVEVWPLIGGSETVRAPWDVPSDYAETADPATTLAAHVAATVAAWIDAEPLAAEGRRVRPGDVMVLVRRRHRLMHALVRELRRRDVPVAGVDRMVLTQPLAVRDLTGLIDAALLPEDDLTLAAVLKGPFVGLDEDALYGLAAGRPRGMRLWTALQRAARGDERLARAHRWLAALFARADFATPHAYLCAALNGPHAQDGAISGRQALLGRLGLEAEDPVDELLTQALAFERRHAPTLQGFARWLGRSELEITRDLEHGRDEVRVLTVHGAKGLEAPIVILPDTIALPREQGPVLRWFDRDGGGLLWSGRATFAERLGTEAKAARRHAEEAEHRRLLYVALTRAADRLIIAGWTGREKLRPGSWYDLVRGALEPIATRFPFAAWPGDGLRLASGVATGAERRAARAATAPPPLPGWLRAPAPVDAPTLPPIAPSRGPDEPPAGSPAAAERDRRLRGRLIHRLLQVLPDVAPPARADLAQRLLARHGAGVAGAARAEIAATVLALLDSPDLAPLFAPGSRAEVPIVGVVGERVVAGQVDRLVIGPEAITIADYKSDRAPPADPTAIPAAYRRQMALYTAVLRQVFPDRPVRAFLVWTEGPAVMAVPDLA